MFNFLEKIRTKPEKQKKQIAFFVSLLIAGIIFVIWLTSVYPDFVKSQSNEQKVANLEPSPFSAFVTKLSSGISSITSKFSEIKDSVSSFSTSSAYYTETIIATSTTNIIQQI